MTDVRGRIDHAEKSRSRSKDIGCTVSLILVICGGELAWGVGGAMFGFGLWIALALVADEISNGQGASAK